MNHAGLLLLGSSLLLAGCAVRGDDRLPAGLESDRGLSLEARGKAALAEGDWMTASTAFSQAYIVNKGEARKSVGFYWGYALFRLSEEAARNNGGENRDLDRQARRLMSIARELIEASGRPESIEMIEAIDAYLDRQPIRPLIGPPESTV